MLKNIFSISVKNLVAFILRSGHIDTSYRSSKRAIEGIVVHQKLQKKNSLMAKNNNFVYDKEVFLKYKFDYHLFTFQVEGRADGVFYKDGLAAIEEIKSTRKDLAFITQPDTLHLAQAKCYGFLFLKNHDSHSSVAISITYCNVFSFAVHSFDFSFTYDELEAFFFSLIAAYYEWALMSHDFAETRCASVKALAFPFGSYRKFQKNYLVAVYNTIVEKKKIFVEAPTGCGKTISSLFPAVKAQGSGFVSKIFYLTAKTVARQAACDAVRLMIDKGTYIKCLCLTAKEKICANPGMSCDPESCAAAHLHFNRVNEAIKDILLHEMLFTRELIAAYALKHNVCPFEFSLSLIDFSDVVICDYNYVFDPKVSLKNLFENKTDFVFLIDEAHNLVDRAKEMFSAQIAKSDFMKIKKLLAQTPSNKSDPLKKILKSVNKCFLDIKKSGIRANPSLPSLLLSNIKKFAEECDKWFLENEDSVFFEDMLAGYFNAVDFIKISDLFDKHYVTFTDVESDVCVKLLCLDPSFLLREACKKASASVFFSATLSPLSFFRDSLGGSDYILRLPSPFNRENLLVCVEKNISTKYRNRENSLEQICDYTYSLFRFKKGNYIAFFPSYEYMHKVLAVFTTKYPSVPLLIQRQNMTETEREDFIATFEHETGFLAFATLGGIFSEGIDLAGDQLSGVVIVSVGLPKITPERNVMTDYYDKKNNKGFSYAYMYPGMNKVMQAAGRVIRTENDRGVIFLIDQRFAYTDYKTLFPHAWENFVYVNHVKGFETILQKFWNG